MQNQEHRRKRDKHGLRIGMLNQIAALLAVALGLFILWTAYGAVKSHNRMLAATEEYIECRTDASDMQAGSDYLTDRVRAFVVTGDIQHIRDFFTETEETRRRDHALEHMGQDLEGKEAYRFLSEALDLSNQLIKREHYSMRLGAEARGIGEEELPGALQLVELSAEDRAKSAEEQMALAQEMVFDGEYYEAKQQITENVDRCVDALMEETRRKQIESSQELDRLLRRQAVLTAAMIILIALLVAFNIRDVMIPLRRFVEDIKAQKELPMEGAYELQFLAEAYNTVLLENRRNHELLSYEATHDPLTGLYNRGAFENERMQFTEGSDETLLLIDVDEFKSVNDTWGHDIGDRVLTRVATLLVKEFRTEDMPCRIGGDEFAVFMYHAGRDLKPVVERKIKNIREKLSVPEGNVPAVTLSVGVAFGNRINGTGDIYKDADTALYQVKNNGRNGIAFIE